MLEDYLIRDVRLIEFRELKAREQDIFDDVMKGFSETYRSKVKDIKTSFKYNLERKMIGIHIEINEQPCLIINQEGLDHNQILAVDRLYDILKERLNKLQLKREDWVDSI